MTDQKTLYLLDGTAYLYRAFHAIRGGLTNSKGLPTNATFGFTKMLLKLLEDRHPEYIAILFDAKGKTFRHEMYGEYKANRPPMPEDMALQIPCIKDVVKAMNLPCIEQEGFEADDLIGTLARQAEEEGFQVVMVTGDKDFLQLVTEKITIWDPMKDKNHDIKSVRGDFGLEPSQLIDVMGFSGDTADNVPGVPGVGPKTAQALIREFGSMAGVYEQVETITKKKQKEKLITFKEQALLSRELVTIKTDSPVQFDADAFQRKEPDADALVALFKEFEFGQLLKMFQKDTPKAQKKYFGVQDEKALKSLIKKLQKADILALDTETTGLDPMKASLVGLSFAVQANEAFYIPCCHDYLGAPEQLALETVLEALRTVLEDPECFKVGQNIKYDWMILSRHGIDLKGVVFDTMVASYLINPLKRAHNLDRIALDYLDHKTIPYADVGGKGKNALGFNEVLVEEAIPYACEDADITLMAYEVFKPMLDEIGASELMETVEMPLIPVLKAMEMTGMTVDQDKLRELSKSFALQLEQLESEIYSIAGETFNINSSQQLGQILFDKLKLPVQKKTKKKTGYSTDVEVLTKLADQHELPALVLRHRTLSKLKSTYADALLNLVHTQTKRIHTSFNQTVTATGRLSSSEPNLQNIPIRTDEGMEIRRAFIPRKGWKLMAADYSQIELRLLAHYSEDPILLEAFDKEEDIHTRTAGEVFQVFPQMITPDLRRQAKTINFGIIYGMGAFSLAKELSISRKMAQTYINHYFARYKGVQAFIDDTIEEARKTGRTTTLLGRVRKIPEINSSNKNQRGFAERTAVNTPIQGTAADFIKLAMIRVQKALEEKAFQAKMLLTVHDELVFEAPPEEMERLETLVLDIMENVWPDLKTPLKVNADWGENWAEAH